MESISSCGDYIKEISICVEKLKNLIDASKGNPDVIKAGLLEDETIFSCLENPPEDLQPILDALEKIYLQGGVNIEWSEVENFFKTCDSSKKEVVLKFSEYLKFSYLAQYPDDSADKLNKMNDYHEKLTQLY